MVPTLPTSVIRSLALVGSWVHNRIRCDEVQRCSGCIPYDASYDAGALSHHYRCVLRTTFLARASARAPVRICAHDIIMSVRHSNNKINVSWVNDGS